MEEPFGCPQCSRCFGQRAMLLAHQKVHVQGGPLICTECGKGLSTKRCFGVHRRNRAKQKGHSSSVVQIKEEPDFGFRSEESVLENMAREGDEAQECSIPRIPSNPKTPPWKIQVKEEPEPPADGTASTAAAACQKLHVKEEPPENPACGKLFDSKVPPPVLQGRRPQKEEDADGQHEWEVPVVNKHVLHMKEEPEESIDFGMCYGQKPNPSAIQRIQIKEEPGAEANHQESQSPERKQEKCCQPTKEEMLENRKKPTSRKDPSAKGDPRGEQTFPCPACGKSFNQKATLFRHQTTHARMGPCKCTKCGKCFPHKLHLIKHQLLHSRGGAHKCGVCGKRYRLKKYLRRHQKIHTREGASPCSKFGENARAGPHHAEQRALGPVKSEGES